MNEDFVPFELAKKLKENGFNMPCLAFYASTGTFYYNNTNVCADVMDLLDCCNASDEFDDIDAPTISQVLKWLRDEKGYHVEFVGNACGYLFIVSDIPSKGGTDRHCSDYDGPNDGGCWDSYEAAALAGIEYCLDNLI